LKYAVANSNPLKDWFYIVGSKFATHRKPDRWMTETFSL